MAAMSRRVDTQRGQRSASISNTRWSNNAQRFRLDVNRAGPSQDGSLSGDPDSPWADCSGSASPSLNAAERFAPAAAASIGPGCSAETRAAAKLCEERSNEGTELLLDKGGSGLISASCASEEGLEVLSDDLVEQGVLGLVALILDGAGSSRDRVLHGNRSNFGAN